MPYTPPEKTPADEIEVVEEEIVENSIEITEKELKSIQENPPKDKGSESEPLNDEGQITLF